MNTSIIDFIIRQFAGKISAAIWSGILFALAQAVAYIAQFSPQAAHAVNVPAVANFVAFIIIAALNVITNKYHLDKATTDKLESDFLKSEPKA